MVTHSLDVEEFLDNYIEAALATSLDDNDDPLDKKFDKEDLAAESLEKMRADCVKFIDENAADLATWERGRYTAEEMGGHDFWLTRNGHGAGFWDGDWDKEVGKRLTDACKKFSEVNLYVGDDGKLYI